jgi:hypothetical protein
MPAYDYAPRFALASRFDAREWSAATALLTRNGTTTSATAGSAIIHGDAVDFLTGRGSDPTATEILTTQAPGAITATATINDDDKLHVTIVGTASIYVDATADNVALGFTNAPTPAGLTHVAASDFPRGNQTLKLQLRNAAGTEIWEAPTPTGDPSIMYQTVPVMLRGRGAAIDADDVTGDGCLEALELAAHGPGAYIRWGIDEDGYVWWEVDDVAFASAAAATPTWDSTTLRDRLGFDGTETTQDLSATRGVYRGEAANPLPGFIAPTRPVQRLDVGAAQVGSSVRRVDTTRAFVGVATHRTWDIDWHLDGPSDAVDLSQHWLRACVPYLYEGAPVTLYQDWGDTRRAGLAIDGAVYGALHTVEFEPYRGRLLLQMAQHAGSRLNWPGPMRRRMPISLAMEEP